MTHIPNTMVFADSDYIFSIGFLSHGIFINGRTADQERYFRYDNIVSIRYIPGTKESSNGDLFGLWINYGCWGSSGTTFIIESHAGKHSERRMAFCAELENVIRTEWKRYITK